MSERPVTVAGLYRRSIRAQRGRLLLSLGLISLWNVCEALVPMAIGWVIDDAVATGDLTAMAWWSLGLCGLFAVLSFSYRFGSRVGYAAMQYEAHRLRGDVVRRVSDPGGQATPRLPGELVSLATSDADEAASALRLVPFVVAGLASAALSVVYLLTLDVLLALVIVVGVPAVLAVTRLLAPRLARRAEERQERIARASGVAADLVTGLRVLKGVGGERAALRHYTAANRAAADAGVQAARSAAQLSGCTTFASGLLLALVAVLAGQRALDGELSIGEFIAVVGLTQFLAEPLRMIGAVAVEVASSVGSARRLVACFGDAPAVRGGRIEEFPPGPLVVRDLLEVHPGELVALVVDDPAVGDELVDRLAVARPVEGRISLGGVDLDEATLDAVREAVVVSRHRVDVAEGTLRSNVVTHAEPGEDEWEAVLAASALEDVVGLDARGIDRPVAAGGTTLSGGQRQRLALARAVAARPRVLVLHDPTTAVDAVTEQRIAAGLRAALPTSGAVLVLTSSPALLAAADRVVHLRADGERRTGSHVDLLREDGYQQAVLR
ncbi:ABC transporter ATP-binding protein [Nocardioides sp. R-C-SC26]|uniref:ABC transporter transmembrane domain-containing protein n=1 Tax=Nocardioides sp. R-C-SC26 TaxID=2870414 RepID=UPI001E2A3DC0|nr:ABC transporter ATP-binding protein [Nocardioides sp. R-C-SC26]